MKQNVAFMLLSLAALSGYVCSQRCPNPVECTVDPCDDPRCPAFITVQCRADNCSRKCIAKYFDASEKDVTSQCFRGFETCKERKCAGTRMCVEEDVDECGPNRRCQKTRCILQTVRRPMTCDDIECTDKKTKCEIFETRGGSIPKCVVYIPQTCEEVDCEEGMVCEVRERAKDSKPVARCIAGRANPENPRRGDDCSEVKCDDDEVCIQLEDDGGARCAKPPPPSDCSQLQCPINMECLPTANGRRVRCVPRKEQAKATLPSDAPSGATPRPLPSIAKSCDDLDCEEGYRCRLVVNKKKNGNRQPVPTCQPTQCPLRRRPGPPRSCRELECGSREVCVLCGEGERTRARCQAVDGDRDGDRDGNGGGDRDRPGRGDRVRGDRRRPPATCEELECDDEIETCEVFPRTNRTDVAMCVPIADQPKCDDLKCEHMNETCVVLTNDDLQFAFCARQRRERPTGRPNRPRNGTRPTGERPTGRPNRPRNGTRPTGERPTGRPNRPRNGTRPTGEKPTGRPNRPRNGTRPTGERPTGRPNRPRNGTRPTGERPTGRPNRPRNGTRPTGEKPTGRPNRPRNGTRPTGERPTGRPNRPRNGTRPTGERPTGRPNRPRNGTRPTGERPTGRPNRPRNGTRPTGEKPTGRPNRPRNGTRPTGERPTGRPNRPRNGTRPTGERPTGRPNRPRNGTRPTGERPTGRPNRPRPTGRPNKPAERCEELECSRGFECLQGRREGRRIARCVRERDDEMCRLGPEDDNEGTPPRRTRPTTEAETEDKTEDKTEDRSGTEDEVGENEQEGEDEGTSSRPTRRPPPAVLNLPDLCAERSCCDGQKCFVRQPFEDRPPIAFCAPVDFTGKSPPMLPPPSCEELECGERFECRERSDESGRVRARCVRLRNNGTRPTRPPTPPTGTGMGTRTRPTRPPTPPTGTRTRPTGTRTRPTRPPTPPTVTRTRPTGTRTRPTRIPPPGRTPPSGRTP